MKWISKINRGAILTGIVIFGVIVYLIAVFIVQRASIPQIKEICSEYIALDVKYSMLPEDQRKEIPDMSEEEIDAYIGEMESDISVFYPEGDLYSKYAINAKTASLMKQSTGFDVIKDYTKEITKFRTFIFKDDTVTVTILTETELEKVGQDSKDIMAMGKLEMEDHMILMKVGGDWKVIHAEINTPEFYYDEYPNYK